MSVSKYDILPIGSAPEPVLFPHFPTCLQAVIWRNWGLVPLKRLALVLHATEKEILMLALEMGLPLTPHVDSAWIEKSYITIIRRNWHILPYEQLLQLLDWSVEKMALVLKEEDFLWHKLGSLKPRANRIVYRSLTEDEKKNTATMKDIIHRHFPDMRLENPEPPFAFINKYDVGNGIPVTGNGIAFNFIYPYAVSAGDFLLWSESDLFPDNLLRQYSKMGIKGIWFHIILYLLYPIVGAEKLSEGYEARLKNLKKLVQKARKFGIEVYLYLNEPRCLPSVFYDNHQEWKGVETDDKGFFSNCTSRSKAPLQWLEEACYFIFKHIPNIAGGFLVTKSENPTHCYSHGNGEKCPFCLKRSIPEVISEIVRVMERGIHNAAPYAKVIVWNWGWKREWEHEALELLPDNLYFMCVSESGKSIEVAGIKSEVGEYSISQMGPSTRTSELWKHAKERGLKIVAKIQINNSWESPFVPYLPVPYLIREHLRNLHRNQVDGIMLSWTLGGYPGGNLELLTHTPEEIAEYRFGKMLAPTICKSLCKFSKAFKLFPFHVKVLYYAPLSCGPGNLLWLNKTGFSATMVGFPYDDLSLWRGIYSDDVMEMSFKQLSETWQDGLDLLELGEPALTESALDAFVDLKNVATAAYCHFRSIYLQIRFIRLRGNMNKLELLQILDEEIILAKRLHAIVLHDSRIGFEASNHYFYTVNDLKEKVLNCEHIKSQINRIGSKKHASEKY